MKPTDMLPAMLAVNLAIVSGLIAQGAADKAKLLSFLGGLVADLPETERQEPYGRLLQEAIRYFDTDQFPTATLQ